MLNVAFPAPNGRQNKSKATELDVSDAVGGLETSEKSMAVVDAGGSEPVPYRQER